MRRARCVCAALAALVWTPPVQADDLAVRARSDEERREGILDVLVRGEMVELLGVQLTPAPERCEPVARAGSEDGYLHLAVPTEASGDLDATVRELPSNYLMHPARFSSKGFRWRRDEVIEPAGIAPERLAALVRAVPRHFYYPALLGDSATLPRTPGYRFVYEIAGAWQIRWEIHAGDGEDLVGRGEARGVKGLSAFCWDGRRLDGSAAPPGPHLLRGALRIRAGQPVAETLHVRFQKYNEPLR